MRYSPEQARARRQHRENPNPTERPEERDSLEDRVARWEEMATDWRNNNAPGLKHQLGVAAEALRTLINEVKERDRRLSALEHPDSAWSRLQRQRTALEAEVNDLREENARLGHAMSQTQMFKREQALNSRIKQMEEALRDALSWLENVTVRDEERPGLNNAIANARAALSPSDTEEEAE